MSESRAYLIESLGTCFRNRLYPLYKSRRPPTDEHSIFQMPSCKNICHLFGIPTLASTTYKADDLIGSIMVRHRRQGRPSTTLSRDKDLGQLLRDGDRLWYYPADKPVSAVDIQQKFGVLPAQLGFNLNALRDS